MVVLAIALLIFPFCRFKDYQKLRYMTILIIGSLMISFILLIVQISITVYKLEISNDIDVQNDFKNKLVKLSEACKTPDWVDAKE